MTHFYYKLYDYFFALDIYADNILEAYNQLFAERDGDMTNIESIYDGKNAINFDEQGNMVNWQGQIIESCLLTMQGGILHGN